RDLAELGAVPADYDVDAAFRPALEAIAARVAKLEGELEQSLARRLQAKENRQGEHAAGRQKAKPSAKDRTSAEKILTEQISKLHDDAHFLQGRRNTLHELLPKIGGWIAFFHTNATHRVLSIRFRKPWEKRFCSFCPSKHTGLFGHGL